MSLFGKSDYYAEEKSLSAAKTVGRPPAQNNTTAMGSKMYGKSMHEYEDVDIETLLSKLSPDELLELNNDFDPDNSLLPPSQRIRDQTDKDPTGPFQREKLLKFLEEKAHNEKDWEERVPYNPGEKRGKVFVSEDQQRSIDSNDDPNNMDMPIELDVDDELEEALEAAPERDLVDLAGILGMHSMLSQAQYYNALKGKPQDETTGMSFTGVIKSSLPKIIPEEPPNQTNVDDCIERLQKDDSEMTDINLNNMKRVPKERIKTLIKTAAQSTHLRKFSLANTAITDAEARGLVELLETSRSLTVLNVESNFLTPELLAKLLRASLETQTLVEFHAENQRATVLGNQIEMDMMQSIEENETLLRVGIAFQSMEARHRVSEALERNYERLRLRRIEG